MNFSELSSYLIKFGVTSCKLGFMPSMMYSGFNSESIFGMNPNLNDGMLDSLNSESGVNCYNKHKKKLLDNLAKYNKKDINAGADFDKQSAELKKDGASYKISENESEDAYKKDITALGKSYLAYIDKTFGNNDGNISKDELIKFLQKDAKTEKEKGDASQNATNMFKSLNQNNDEKLDYKEITAMFYAMDYDENKKKTDGLIESKQYNGFLTQIFGESPTEAFMKIIKKGNEILSDDK